MTNNKVNKIDLLNKKVQLIEDKIDIINGELINLINVLEKLTDRSKDIEMNIRYLYTKSKEEDNKIEPLKTGWLF